MCMKPHRYQYNAKQHIGVVYVHMCGNSNSYSMCVNVTATYKILSDLGKLVDIYKFVRRMQSKPTNLMNVSYMEKLGKLILLYNFCLI